jgi:hypothetical protein
MIFGALVVLEGLGVFAMFAHYVVRINGFARDKKTVLNKRQETIGKVLTFVAFAFVAVFTGLSGGRTTIANSDHLFQLYVVVSTTGFLLFYTGFKFGLAAYQPPEETGKYVNTIDGFFKLFWDG